MKSQLLEDWYKVCIYYVNGEDRCNGARIKFSREECMFCPIKFKMLGCPTYIKEKPEQTCHRFNPDKDACVKCRKKRAGKSKACRKPNKLSTPQRIKKRSRKRPSTFEKIKRAEGSRSFNEMMKKKHEEMVRKVRENRP